MLERFTLPFPGDPDERRVFVCLPEGYDDEPDARYPVLYFFDGQNIFRDEDAAFGTSWDMAGYMAETGTPVIAVGLESSPVGDNRLIEYSPFSHGTEDLGLIRGRGRTTLSFLCDVLKPVIDERYRTLPGRDSTIVAGSSMGGLMALYAVTHRSDVFSAAAALSPSLWVHPGKAHRMIEQGDYPPHTLIYMDYGSEEMGNHRDNWRALTETVHTLLVHDCDLTFRIVPGGDHSEASWRTRIPVFMSCLGF